MSADKSDKPGETDSLSATGMFLRAFGENAKPETTPSDPLAKSPLPGMPQPSVQQPASGSKVAPGEFTQLFQSLEAKPVAAPAPGPQEPQFRPTSSAKAPSSPLAEPAGDRGPGEFTRIFVGGAPSPSPRGIEEPTRAVPLPTSTPSASRSKGFSAPGVSGSASGEGSFTQLFNTPPPSPSGTPAQPPVSSSPRNPAWNNDPIFRTPQNPPPAEPSSSVTNLIASLGAPSDPGAAGRHEPVPYRPDPIPRSAPLASSEPQVSSEGVTRLIQRLAQTPVEQAPVAPATPPPVNSGPGEFTRMISRMELSTPVAEPAPAAPPPAAQPAPAAFAFPATPAVPAVPHLAAPAVPHAAAPKFTPPAVPSAPLPAVPKPPALVAPALAPPKSKLESMVPILLVINTFLLLILLIVVIFLIKSK